MTAHYQYRCFHCQSQFSAQEIEATPHYLCPRCGGAEKNKPLQGVLLVEYDYPALGKKYRQRGLPKWVPGQFWDYPELWPLELNDPSNPENFRSIRPELLPRLRLNPAPLLRWELDGRLVLLFDDSRNPTFSFKDRASILVAVKALQLGQREIAVASTGNAASSLAGICARLGLVAHVFVPEAIPAAKRMQIQAYGAHLYPVQGDYDQAFDLCLEIADARGWYNRNTAYNPLTIEGKKSAAFDIRIACQGELPDAVIVPVGDGVILAGLYKGFSDLRQLGLIEKMPRLLAIQAQGSAALVRYLQSGSFDYQPAQTLADSISAGAPRNLYLAAQAVQDSGGTATAVSDAEIIQAQQTLARQGLLVEPAAAASLAGYQKLQQTGSMGARETCLLMLTGNGLKDVDVLRRWNPPVLALSAEKWRERLVL